MTASSMPTIDPGPQIHEVLARLEREHPDEPLPALAHRAYRTVSADLRRRALLDLLEDRLQWQRRARVREIERAAERRQRQEEWRQAAERRQAEQDAARAERERLAATDPRYAHPQSKRYLAFIATPAGAAFHEQRLQERAEREEAKRQRQEARAQARLLRESEAERRRVHDEEVKAAGGITAYYFGQMNAIVAEFRAGVVEETRLELTRELLGAEFALGDGSRVTWAKATAQDHARRVDLLAGNVRGNLATINRHRAAVQMLEQHQVRCLGEIQPHEDAAAA